MLYTKILDSNLPLFQSNYSFNRLFHTETIKTCILTILHRRCTSKIVQNPTVTPVKMPLINKSTARKVTAYTHKTPPVRAQVDRGGLEGLNIAGTSAALRRTAPAAKMKSA